MAERLGSLAPLRHPNFRWYFAGITINVVGSNMAGVALAFAVLGISGSARDLGLVLAASAIPSVLFMLFGGVAANRLPVVLVLRTGLFLAGAVQAVAAALVITGAAHIWMLVCLEAVSGTALALTFPAMGSMMPRIVPHELLQQANVMNSFARGVMRVVGPTVGALVVVTAGAGWALAVDAATWIVAAALVSMVRLPPQPEAESGSSTIGDLRAGWSYVRRTTWLWVVMLAFAFLNAILAGAMLTLGPARAEDTIGRQGWGYVLSAASVGMIVLSLVMTRWRIQRPLVTAMVGMMGFGVLIFLMGYDPELAPLLVIAFLAGAGSEAYSLGWSLAMQEHVPENMLSRAYSYDAVGSYAAMPLGQLLIGPIAAAFGDRDVMIVGGALYVVICLLTLASASVRDLRRVPAPVAEAVT